MTRYFIAPENSNYGKTYVFGVEGDLWFIYDPKYSKGIERACEQNVRHWTDQGYIELNHQQLIDWLGGTPLETT